MNLVEQHIIKRSDGRFKELDHACFLSKNLYNIGLFNIRQHYFDTKKFLTYIDLNKLFVKDKQEDYYKLPTKVSQQTLKLLEQNFKSFFGSIKSKKVKKSRIPKYLDKCGRFTLVYTIQSISSKRLKEGYLKLSGLDVEVKTSKKDIKQARVIHKGDHIVIEIIYQYKESKLKEDNGRYCSIDLGLNNLMTIGSNKIKPIIINGRPLKSINQYYNKKLSKLKSEIGKGTSKRIKRLTSKRNNKIKDYLHKSSRHVINHLISNDINTLIIGKNNGWKKEINIGKVNNQKFVQIPHNMLVNMLVYKCKLEGINLIQTEESYTSKCSFIDGEDVKKHENYKGKRIKRGLFRSSNGILINADLNGSLNILKKVVGKFEYPIEVCSAPLVHTIKLN